MDEQLIRDQKVPGSIPGVGTGVSRWLGGTSDRIWRDRSGRGLIEASRARAGTWRRSDAGRRSRRASSLGAPAGSGRGVAVGVAK